MSEKIKFAPISTQVKISEDDEDYFQVIFEDVTIT